MPKISLRVVSLVSAAALTGGLLVGAVPARADESTDRYLVTTTSSRVTAAAADDVEDNGGEVDHEFRRVLDGFSAELTPAQVAEVRADPRVEDVVPDGRVRASGNQLSPPWGLDRIDQTSLPLDRGYGYQRDRRRGDGLRDRHGDPGDARRVRWSGEQRLGLRRRRRQRG